jgi:Leucine-rich repeat (LRR) protein
MHALTRIPHLPDSLRILDCSGSSYIKDLPNSLPKNLKRLACGGTSIAVLPSLPNTLEILFIGFCKNLFEIPHLPDHLRRISFTSSCLSQKAINTLHEYEIGHPRVLNDSDS